MRWFRRLWRKISNSCRCSAWHPRVVPGLQALDPKDQEALERFLDRLRVDPDSEELLKWVLLNRDRRLLALMDSVHPDPVDAAEARTFQALYNFLALTKTEKEE